MPKADVFARIACNELRVIAPDGAWECGQQMCKGAREAVDLCGKPNGKLVYIEIELRRDEPLTNVVKLWKAIDERRHTKKVILVQAFSGHYPSRNTHRDYAVFIGEHMQRFYKVKYLPLYFKYRPAKDARVCGDYCHRAAKSLASDIWGLLRKEL